jgi:hypothetical protein
MGRPSIRALPGTSKREASRSGRTDVRDMGPADPNERTG